MSFFQKLFYDYQWCCAYRRLSDEERKQSIIPKSDEIRTYNVVKMPRGYWAADPFLLNEDGKYHLFFEFTNLKKDKAVLGATELNGNGHIHWIYEFKGHTSYPCIFKVDDVTYMIPETCAERKIQLLISTGIPYKWEKIGTLAENLIAVDCTPFYMDGKVFLMVFCLEKEFSGKGDLCIGQIDFEKNQLKDFSVAKKYKCGNGRPAGACFIEDKKHYRVVQFGERYYGERMDFYEFSYENGNYSERKCGEFRPDQVRLDKPYIVDGIHTINRVGDYEVIDVRLARKFDLFRPVKKVFQRLGVFGYQSGDKKMLYVNGKYPIHENQFSKMDK